MAGHFLGGRAHAYQASRDHILAYSRDPYLGKSVQQTKQTIYPQSIFKIPNISYGSIVQMRQKDSSSWLTWTKLRICQTWQNAVSVFQEDKRRRRITGLNTGNLQLLTKLACLQLPPPTNLLFQIQCLTQSMMTCCRESISWQQYMYLYPVVPLTLPQLPWQLPQVYLFCYNPIFLGPLLQGFFSPTLQQHVLQQTKICLKTSAFCLLQLLLQSMNGKPQPNDLSPPSDF